MRLKYLCSKSRAKKCNWDNHFKPHWVILRTLWTYSFILFRISCILMKLFGWYPLYNDILAESEAFRGLPGLEGQLWKSRNACSINPWGPSRFWVIFWFLILLEGLKLIILRRLKGQKVFLAERGIAEESGADQWKLKWTWILRFYFDLPTKTKFKNTIGTNVASYTKHKQDMQRGQSSETNRNKSK